LDFKAIEKALTDDQKNELKAYNLADLIDNFTSASFNMD
jgi:hypothetical protein